MIREALDRMALGERAVLAGVEVERVSLFGFRLWGGPDVFTRGEAASLFMGAPSWQEMTAGGVVVFAGRGAVEAREPWELEVAGSIPAVQTGAGVGAGVGVVLADSSPAPSGFDARGSTERAHEKLLAGAPETAARIAELRRQHGRALRVTGKARAKRARWTGQEAWLVVSYPKEARGT